MSDQRFPKSLRIKSSEAFGRIIQTGAYATDDTLVVNVLPNDLPYSRLGITIPKRTGNAVLRNRWKRLIREAFRTQKDQFPSGFDFVVRPRRGAVADFKSIQSAIVKLAQRAAKRCS
ncbi:MAG: ribonuclease P protein component [Pirellulaceae bacterium]